MGHTKTELHSPARNRQANLFKSLGHPARLAIVEYLLLNGPSRGLELREESRLTQATFAQHMLTLSKYRMLKSWYQGRELYYEVVKENMELIVKLLNYWKKLHQPMHTESSRETKALK